MDTDNHANNATIALSTTAELDLLPNGEEQEIYVMASLKAPLFEDSKRVPIDLVCVIDRSGSMSGEKLDLTKQTLRFVVKQLKASDRLAIVQYDNTVDTPLELTNMNETGKATAESAISKIQARGSTDICSGMLAGLKIIKERTTKNEVASVLLFTDGLANAGITSTEGIIEAMRNPTSQRLPTEPKSTIPTASYSQLPPPTPTANNPAPAAPQAATSNNAPPGMWASLPQSSNTTTGPSFFPPAGASLVNNAPPSTYGTGPSKKAIQVEPIEDLGATVHTFGFGSDHDGNTLKAIADAGRGVYFFIETSDLIPDAFSDCLGGLLSVVGQNIVLNFKALQPYSIKSVDTKFKQVENEANQDFSVSLGDMQSEEGRDILCKVKLSAGSATDVLKVSLSYFNVITSLQEETSATAVVQRPAQGQPTRSFAVDRQRNRITAANAMEEAKKLGDANQLPEARKVVQAAIDAIKQSLSSQDPFCQSLVKNLQDSLSGLQDRTTYSNFGGYTMSSYASAHQQQRANTKTSATYGTSARAASKAAYAEFPGSK